MFKNCEELLTNIKKYIDINYDPFAIVNVGKSINKNDYKSMRNIENVRDRVNKNLSQTWQEKLFEIIDSNGLNEVDIYKKAELSRQTFSKIRSDVNYHPDKDTVIRFCLGLKLDLEDSLDFLAKAGYTLSNAIKRDLIFKYILEKKIYDVMIIDSVLLEMNLPLLGKY